MSVSKDNVNCQQLITNQDLAPFIIPGNQDLENTMSFSYDSSAIGMNSFISIC
jgi:hypothetical protein